MNSIELKITSNLIKIKAYKEEGCTEIIKQGVLK